MTAKSFKEYQAEKQEREWAERVKKQKESMGNAQRVERATEWKRIGNDKFKAGNLWEARDYYREAVIYVEDLVDARRKERDELLVPLYSNLAQVDLKLDELSHAELVAGKALEILERPKSTFHSSHRAKAHFRRGQARHRLGRLEEACSDFATALKLQPGSEDVLAAQCQAKEELKLADQKLREQMRGFLTSEAAQREEAKEEKEKRRQQAVRIQEARRKERRALAEQRQHMQTAFSKLSEGKMLYEQREKEMEPVRKREEEKQKTMELEMNLMNIIDDSKGQTTSRNLDEFMDKKKKANAIEQNDELDQKKKILDKQRKETQWQEDDTWQEQRAEHRRRLELERENGQAQAPPPSLWQSTEVSRWCEQRLRDALIGIEYRGPPMDAEHAAVFLGRAASDCSGLVMRGLITDVLKLNGDATVMRLNPNKPPLHFFDYFVKLDWEVALTVPDVNPYRSADDLIGVAAEKEEGRAPKSVLENCVSSGTFKLKEYCSETESPDESWRLATKLKHKFTEDTLLMELAEKVCGELRSLVEFTLQEWPAEFRSHWPC
mmetsp:Transcript_18220/g.42416  ORF Transcript_18220/g.42416 Transcript_18220/m.42416 type:complete len:551 (-) Transcript_18220:23-1675(-)